MTTAGDRAPVRSRRRTTARPVVVAGLLLGAGAVVLAGGRPWASRAVSGVPGLARVVASGTELAPAVTALALVVAAGAIALALAGRLARRVVATLVVLAGVTLLALVASVLRDPDGALAPAVVAATGQSGPVAAGPAAVTAWPWLAVAGGLLVVVGGLLALVAGGSWAVTGRRFTTPVPAASGSGPAATSAEPAGQRATSAESAGQRATARRDRDLDTWDALSRGEDPTES